MNTMVGNMAVCRHGAGEGAKILHPDQQAAGSELA